MRPVVLLAVVGLVLSGCGGSNRSTASDASRPVAIPSADCLRQRLARAPLPGKSGVYRPRFRGGSGLGHPDAGMTDGGPAVRFPVGDSLRGCTATRTRQRLPSSALPFLGVACGRPNWVGCDRIGVGVGLEHDATLVVVRVGGRLVTLSPPSPGSHLWLGYLQGAGPRRGPLRVRSPKHKGLWFGSPEMYPRVRVTAFFADGGVASATARVLLHPGFG